MHERPLKAFVEIEDKKGSFHDSETRKVILI
jgi:hypothetical protein